MLAHIHAVVLIYTTQCSTFNMLSINMFHHVIHAFIYELQVEMSLSSPARVAKR